MTSTDLVYLRSGEDVYSVKSRYKKVGVYSGSDTKYNSYTFSDLASFQYTSDSTDQFYSVEPGYAMRLDLIAYKFYGSVHYWWVIATMNNIIDPFVVNTGDVLRIPSPNRLIKATTVRSAVRVVREY